MTVLAERALVCAGAVAGAAGVALSAVAAHAVGAGSLETAARFLLFHAPAFLALAALLATGRIQGGLGRIAGAALALGLLLFSGDLACRALAGWTPWRLAAPTGGTLLIAGWLLSGLAAIVGRRPPAVV